MAKKEPLLLLDNSTMYVIGAGTYRSSNMSFDEAKAIIEMYDEGDIVRCYTDTEIDKVVHQYLGIEKKNFVYKHFRRMRVGQDAIIFKQYITESESMPVIEADDGVQAKKVENIYIYCQYITRET